MFQGFISTGDARAPGNLGLKDQVIAMRFVKNHIEKFGGDPNSITISGDSAGSWSVILHMLSPMSKGLFHGGIAMSGGPLTSLSLPYDQKDLLLKQAKFLGCPSQDINEIFECFKSKDTKAFVDSRGKFAVNLMRFIY